MHAKCHVPRRRQKLRHRSAKAVTAKDDACQGGAISLKSARHVVNSGKNRLLLLAKRVPGVEVEALS